MTGMDNETDITETLRAGKEVKQTQLPAIERLPLNVKASIIKELMEAVPINEYGLPTHIYRTDLIPADFKDLSAQERGEVLDIAAHTLEYDQGFPTVASGEPFWGRLPFEPTELFNMFVNYLDLTTPDDVSVSTLEKLTKRDEDADSLSVNPTDSTYARSPIRQLHLLSPIEGIDTESLLSYSHMFYWAQRAQAYDLFLVACHRKRKEKLTLELEGQHYAMSTHLLQTSSEILNHALTAIAAGQENEDGNTVVNYKLRDVTDVMWKMFQMQRISLGLSPTGGGSSKQQVEGLQNASVDITLRQIAEEAGIQASAKENNMETAASDAILKDPDMLLEAQNLIIKLNPK